MPRNRLLALLEVLKDEVKLGGSLTVVADDDEGGLDDLSEVNRKRQRKMKTRETSKSRKTRNKNKIRAR